MGELSRLTRTLHQAARGWGEIEGNDAAPEITPIGYTLEPPGGAEARQTAFRLTLYDFPMRSEREYVVTITASDLRK